MLKTKKETYLFHKYKSIIYNETLGEYVLLSVLYDKKLHTCTFVLNHTICGNIYKVRSDAFLKQYQRCPKCAIKRQENRQRLERYNKSKSIYDMTNGEYECIGLICKNKKYLFKIRHSSCGNIYTINYSRFKNGSRCRKCANSNRKSYNDMYAEYYDKFIKLNEKYYEFINIIIKHDNLKNKKRTFLRIKHNICGKIYDVDANSFINHGNRCRECSFLNQRKTHDEFLNKIKDRDIIPLEKYIKTNIKIKFKCKKCNHEWYAKPNSILYGTGCPCCKISKGEMKVSKFLKYKNIKFEMEKTFKDLKGVGGNALRFDFYLYEYNILIEYDGEFHYKDIMGGLEYQITNDKLKSDYCKYNNIKLIRIPYWEFDEIENILEKELSYYNSLFLCN